MLPLVAILVVGILAGGTFAAFMISRQVSMNMSVVAVWGMTLYDTDHATELTTVALGEFHRGDSTLFPGGTDSYTMKNTGELDSYFSYSVSGLSTGVTLVMEFKRNGGTWEPITADSIKATPLAPGASIEWRFTVTVGPTAAFTTSTPQITWNSYSTASG